MLNIPLLWRLPAAALRASIAEMAPDGALGREGVALWLGRRVAGVVSVTHVVGLRGPGVFKTPNHLSISAELLNDVTDVAVERGVYLVGQIHSHPSDWVDLSDADRLYGIQAPGYLSVVAPHFAGDPSTPPGRCGFHVHDRGGWRRLGPWERPWRVAITGAAAPLITVGDVDQ